MMSAEIRKQMGKRIRVWHNYSKEPAAEGTLIGYFDHPALVIQLDDGTQVTESSQLRREVVEPLPEEPPVGSYVEVQVEPDTTPDVYRRVALPLDGWYALTHSGRGPYTWARLHKDGAKVTRLIRDDVQPLADWEVELLRAEQPQEKYEHASDGEFRLWQHTCGKAQALHSTVDPREDPTPLRWCSPNCNKEGGWSPLYVRRTSDGD